MERRRLSSELYALFDPRLERAGFLAAFTERTGGGSEAPFDTLNLGLKTRDRRESVIGNRRALIGALAVGPWAMGMQVHGSRIVRVGASRAGAGFDDPSTGVGDADGLSVTRPLLPVAVITADCLPIALVAPGEGRAVALHAGWRGLAAGAIDAAAASFSDPSEVLAAIGPAIGPCHYEVGPDVALAVAAGSEGGAVSERRDGSTYLDLSATAAKHLRAAGIRRVERAEECTACEERRFFSHRRDGETGRQGLVLMRL